MILELKNCSNKGCLQMFKVWEKDKKEHHFCSESCVRDFRGENGKTYWSSEDRAATALKNYKIKLAKHKEAMELQKALLNKQGEGLC